MALSWPASLRVMSWNRAKNTAEPMGSSAAHWNTAEPGRTTINAPARPTSTATQRRQPTFSPRMGPARATMNSGPVKLITVASASGRKRNAAKMKVSEPRMQRPRATCSHGRLVFASLRTFWRVTPK